MSFASQLDAAAAATTCQVLQNAGGALVGYGAVSLVAGGAGLIPLALGSAALLASNYGCTWDPSGTAGGGICSNWCQATDGAMTLIYSFTPGGSTAGQVRTDIRRITGCVEDSTNQYGGVTWTLLYEDTSGNNRGVPFTEGRQDNGSQARYHDMVVVSGTCTEPPEPFNPGPYDYTDPDTGCSIDVTWLGVGVDSTGFPRPIYKIEPGAQLREGGGIIGGCNFEPVIYVGGGNGGEPPVYGPWDPTWPDFPPQGTPPWLDFINDLIGGVIGNLITDQLTKLFETPYPAGTREIYAACNYKENGDPETFSVTFPEESYQDRVLTSLNAIVDFQQQILLWRTPLCGSGTPKVGDYRTISFVSDEKSPNGDGRVAKRFRYRSSSGLGLDGVVDHWKDFTWSAGPVCVQHKDSQLGSPQVWASSIDEGKRVIRHAAAEAGIDPDQVGRWSVGGSDNPRYGVPGTMRVNTKGGYYWITSRLGPDQRPLVGQT
jgi:hypothetical protein